MTHLAGACLSVVALGVLLWLGIRTDDPRAVIGFAVFGLSQLALYTASGLYHSLHLGPAHLVLLRRIDHMMIFVLIAGTYTPICLVALHGGWRWGLLGTIWGLAAAGLIVKTRWMHAPRWLSTVLYLLMGWVALVAMPALFRALPPGAVIWLLAGGVVYSIGAAIYALKRPNLTPAFDHHAIWHLFVLAGSACFFWVMVAYIA